MPNSKPVVCTLTKAELGARGKRWRDVLARSSAIAVRSPNGVKIRLACDHATLVEIEELVRLERSCCGWMTLELHHQHDTAMLSMTADSEAGVEVIQHFLPDLLG